MVVRTFLGRREYKTVLQKYMTHTRICICVLEGATKMTFVVNQKKERPLCNSHTRRFYDLWRILNPFIGFITIYTIIILNVTYTTSLTNVVPAHCTRGLPSSWNGGQW